MWDLRSRNRSIFVLISVLSGCAVLYNAWGPILALTVSIILVIYMCYSLLTNDSILTPQTFVFIKYIKEACQEITSYLNTVSFYLSSTIRKLYIILNNNYRIYVANKMNRFRQTTYQLSNDTQDTTRNSSRFDLTTNQLSPILRNDCQENISYDNRNRNDYIATKLTSTPLAPFRKDTNILSNGTINLYTPNRPLRQETQLIYGPNHISMRSNDTVFSPEGSPWGTSISPKIRSKAGGVKTVQTVAGPLLASTRYNIDPKVYSDVTSPGLSTRLAKYATEANGKLIHQSQYATGQFPKVNLNASPLPLISAKNVKIRTPVTVRIAPNLNLTKKLFPDVCRAESRASPSVVQVLREISLKRHASREDVSSDLVKKQRTEVLFDESLETLEESKQKRTREDSPNTEEEILARNNQLRPIKKTKTPSCYDVLNSLSSSNQYSSGVKRKASTLDISRSGTPDIEKHFKPSETVQNIQKITVNVTESQIDVRKPQKYDLNMKTTTNMEVDEVNRNLQEQPVVQMKSILINRNGKNTVVDEQQNLSAERLAEIEEKKKDTEVVKTYSPVSNKPINFTDKLFMKAEPQTNERLRTLIQEQGNIRAKFTTDDADEIKKEDIVNMRQTSMRARLQSMFDAISGKPSKKINPDVIIHAEGASEPTAVQATPASLVTLSSTTSTTNVNTTPIATSAVAPTSADSKFENTTTKKHVTFNLPSSLSSVESESSSTKAIIVTGIETSTTETSDLNTKASNSSFGAVSPTTTISPSPSVASSTTLSFPYNQNAKTTSVAVTSSVSSNMAPSSFINPVSVAPNATQSLGSQSLNVTSATNNSLLSVTTTASVAKTSSLASAPVFALPNYTSATTNENAVSLAKPSITFGTVTMPSSGFGSGNFTTDSNKSTESSKATTHTSVPMPNFSFGAPKMSTATSIFHENVQTTLTDTQNQATINNVIKTSATTTIVPNSAAQTQQSAFNTSSTASSIMVSANPAVTASSLFPFGGSSGVPQSTGTGSFSFTTNTNTGKGPIPAFGSSSIQSTTAFGGTATQNLPTFGNTINFQSVQSPGTVATTTTQNASLFGSNLPTNQNPPAFGSAVTTAQNNTFGTVTSSAPPPAFGSTSTTNSFGFGNTTTQTSTVPGFGTNSNSVAPSKPSTSTTNPAFSFGTSAASATKTGFVFGSIAPITTASTTGMGITATPNQISPFGATASNNTAPVYGVPSTTAPPAFGSQSTNVTPVFGAASSTTTSVFGGIAASVTPVFGSASSAAATPLFGSPATTTTSGMFDGTVNQSTFGSVSNSGAASDFSTPKTTAPPAFGSHTSESGFNYGGGTMGRNVLFSGTTLATTSNTAAPATTSSAFGGTVVSQSIFGQTTKSPPSFAASTSATFGNGSIPSFGNPNSSFGATSNPIPAGNPPAFGTQSSTTPAFGTQNPTVKQTPQGPPPAFGSSTSAFGSATTAPPAFGANTATPSGFSSSTSTFGTQNTTAPPSFAASTSNIAPAFGTNVSAPFGTQNQNATPTFGAQNTTTPSFGAATNNPSATFGFGGNQTQSQQNPGLAFTGNPGSTSNNATTAAPFQFGSTAIKPEGFNFNASTTTPNMNFGAAAPPPFGTPTQGSNIFGTSSPAVPAGGMFSIGAGSTAPRSRASRSRRQR